MRRGARLLRVLAAAFSIALLALVALAPAALAGNPAQGQYTLTRPDAGGPGGGGSSHPGGSEKVGGSGGSSALPLLGLGALAIGSGGLALVYARRKRASHEAT